MKALRDPWGKEMNEWQDSTILTGYQSGFASVTDKDRKEAE